MSTPSDTYDDHIRRYQELPEVDPLDRFSNVENEAGHEMTFRELGLYCQRDKASWDHGITNRERERFQKQVDKYYTKLKPFEGQRARTTRWRG